MLLPFVVKLFALEFRPKIGVVVNDNGPPTSIGESAFVVVGLPPEFLDVLIKRNEKTSLIHITAYIKPEVLVWKCLIVSFKTLRIYHGLILLICLSNF